MRRENETKHGGFHLFFLVIGFITLSLVFGGSHAYAQAQKTLIDLNTASAKDLESIKGIGPATAKKIIAGRPYKSVDDLKKAGIPEKTVESMKPYVKAGAVPAKPGAEEKPASSPKPATPAKPAAPPAPAKEVTKAPPTKDAAPASAPAKSAGGTKPGTPKEASKTSSKTVPGQKVNINTATKEQLETLPEIGPVKAQAIIDGRPYKTPEDVMKVKGIKEGTFNKIKDSIAVQ